MIDIGCGLGGMVAVARSMEIEAVGIDGDPTLTPDVSHDFTKGKAYVLKDHNHFDLAWSTEFLEHVEEQYQDNYMDLFSKSSYALVTAAPPGKKGTHHVNCQTSKYWIEVFDKYGFDIQREETNHIRDNNSMQREFMSLYGLFFKNRNVNE